MKTSGIVKLCFFLGTLLVLASCHSTPQEALAKEPSPPSPTGKFLNLSDIHFNPYFDTALVDTLMKSEYKEWERIFESSPQQLASTYNHDSNYPLLKSALDKMKKELDSPDFIMISGDFLSHHFESDFTNYAHVSYQKDQKEGYQPLHAFNEKTMRFIAHQIEKRFPGIPVWATLGNNDAYCGDYLVQPGQSFLSMLADVWKPLLNTQYTGTFDQTFPVGGYYAIQGPFNDKHKVIVLNSILFSINFNDPGGYRTPYCDLGNYGPGNTDPGNQQLIWLKAELDKSRVQGEKVWMMQHIPPGMNVFGTLPKDSTDCVGDTSSYFLKPEFNDKYLALVEEYADIITTNMAGHYHRDDFRLIQNNKGEAVSYMHILPSISPIYYNNPGFEIVEYDKQTTELLDYTTYYTDVQSPAANTNWELEYNFRKTYHQNALTPKNMMAIHQQLKTDKAMAADYMKYYPVSETNTMKDFRFYWCGINHLTPASFEKCVCEQ